MRNIFIIHGVYGNPDENWFPWLKKELEKIGCNVIVPAFPTPEGHNLSNWLKVLDEYESFINKETIFIGHSMAVAFVLTALEKMDHSISSCFFVAGWTGRLNHPLDEINKTFIDRNFDWEKIQKNCKKFYVFNSNNDPYVPLEMGKELAKNLNSELTVVKGAGHFGENAGYKEFPLLLENIVEELNLS